MSYAEEWKQAEKAESVVDVTPQWIAWEKKDQSVLGKLMGSGEVDSTLSSGTYKQYLMDTDEGLIKFSLGAASDKELHTILRVGYVYKITFKGQIKIKGGRKVNQFTVLATFGTDEIQPAEPEVTG